MTAMRVWTREDRRAAPNPKRAQVVDGVPVITSLPHRRPPARSRPRPDLWVGFDDEGGTCALL